MLDLIRKNPSVTIPEMMQALGMSDSGIRKDLTPIATAGHTPPRRSQQKRPLGDNKSCPARMIISIRNQTLCVHTAVY